MADGFSATAIAAMLGIFTDTTPTVYSEIYAQLHTGDPGSAGTANISAGCPTRTGFATTAFTIADGVLSGTPDAAFTNTGTTETLTDVSYWTGSSGGVFLFSEPLTTSKEWESGDGYELTSMSITIPVAS